MINSREKHSLAIGNNFTIEIEKLPFTSAAIQGFTLPHMEMGEVTLPTRILDFARPGSKMTYGKLDIEFSVDSEWNSYLEFHDWLASFRDPEDLSKHSDDGICDGTIILLSNQKNPIIRIRLIDLHPLTLEGIPFGTADTEPVKANAQLSCTHFLIDRL